MKGISRHPRGHQPTLRRRERRGRGLRGPLIPSALPAWRSPAERFDELVLDSLDRLPQKYRPEIDRLEFAVEDVPPTEPTTWDDREVPLSRCFPADRGLPTRIVFYRRPVEARTANADRGDFLHGLMVEQVAHALNLSIADLDPNRES